MKYKFLALTLLNGEIKRRRRRLESEIKMKK